MPVAVGDITYGEPLKDPKEGEPTHKLVTIPAGSKFDRKLFSNEAFKELVEAGAVISEKEAAAAVEVVEEAAEE